LVVADIPSNTSFSIPSYGGYFTSLSWNGSDGAFLIAGTMYEAIGRDWVC